MEFAPNKLLQPIPAGKAFDPSAAMLPCAPRQRACHSDIERPVRPVGDDIDPPTHAFMLQGVDGRDKPGHDGVDGSELKAAQRLQFGSPASGSSWPGLSPAR